MGLYARARKLRGIDMERQKRALAASLYVIVMALEGGDTATMYLDQVARRHGREDLDIRPELYDDWLECLVQAVREYDPQYNTVVEQLWRGVMQEAIKRNNLRNAPVANNVMVNHSSHDVIAAEFIEKMAYPVALNSRLNNCIESVRGIVSTFIEDIPENPPNTTDLDKHNLKLLNIIVEFNHVCERQNG